MWATVIRGIKDVKVEEVPDSHIQAGHDALVRVTHTCICGSDLWAYKGVSKRRSGQRMGHEFIGLVEDTGADVSRLRLGQRVLAPFTWADGACEFCLSGLPTSCVNGGVWGLPGADGAQGELVRVPFADATLVPLPGNVPEAMMPALLTLSDVMSTGHHAAITAGVKPGSRVAVVGDGAVGLCAVLAARRLGAEEIIILGRHAARTTIARRFGATHVVSERGPQAVTAVREISAGHMADAVLEAAGTAESMRTALALTRDGGTVGFVGMPYGGDAVDLGQMFDRNITLAGGVAPARKYIPELLPEVLERRLDPSAVFDKEIALADIHEGYAAMDSRVALKVLIRM
ncbi:alcohol dehydrogenase catalytic domain-containing protein [Nonomuraea sp. NPDC049758]|uniref:zinc-binding dehydrogenase n=1 Tax=Nonomuraea sp. NPDC049758 TaxID=3154360 RepID=UPI0034492C2F